MSSFTYPISKKQLNDLYHDYLNEQYKALITRIINDISHKIILAAQNGLNKLIINNQFSDNIHGVYPTLQKDMYLDITLYNVEDILVKLKERFPDTEFRFNKSEEPYRGDLAMRAIFPIIINISWE